MRFHVSGTCNSPTGRRREGTIGLTTDLCQRIISVTAEDVPEDAYRRAYQVVLDIELEDGKCLSVRCDKPEGHYHREPVTAERHRIEIHDCVRRIIGDDGKEEFVSLASRFHALTSAEATRLLTLSSTAGNA